MMRRNINLTLTKISRHFTGRAGQSNYIIDRKKRSRRRTYQNRL